MRWLMPAKAPVLTSSTKSSRKEHSKWRPATGKGKWGVQSLTHQKACGGCVIPMIRAARPSQCVLYMLCDDLFNFLNLMKVCICFIRWTPKLRCPHPGSTDPWSGPAVGPMQVDSRCPPQAHAGPSHQGGPGGAAEVWGCQVYMRVEVWWRESTGRLYLPFTELLFSTSLGLRFFHWTEVPLLTSSISELVPLFNRPCYICVLA